MGLQGKVQPDAAGGLLVGLALAASVSWRIVQRNARARGAGSEADIMMAQADAAIRDYTTQEIAPLLATR